MRVISGIYKHRRFDIPKTFKARPTTDFAKENLFNVLCNYIDFDNMSALDLFSGTGSISLELLSRGCSHVVSIEKDSTHYSFIRKVMKEIQTENCVPLRGEVFRFLKICHETYDIIFADPPYVLKGIPQLPDIIFERQLLKPNGIFILEHGKDHRFDAHPHFFEHREYGSVNFSFFK
jgi:N6-adenine-specific methylase